MKARAIETYLRSLNGGWVNYADTVDTWKAGDPDTDVTGIAVGWMSYTWALQKAAALGCNLFITHEPTFYHHLDNDAEILAWPESRSKLAWIEAHGLILLRCHDLWDLYPGLGMADSWGQKLGLGKPIASNSYFRVYAGDGRTAMQLARDLAGRVKDLGQPGVHLIGAPERPIYRIVHGAGAITPYHEMLVTYKADLVICEDDGFCYWQDAAHAIDNGHNILVFHHAVSEEYGMELMGSHLAEAFPDVPVHYIRQSCMYQFVQAG